MSSAKWRPFCLGLNELKTHQAMLQTYTSYISLWCGFYFINHNIPNPGPVVL